MTPQPAVSVILPTFNRCNLLPRALASVLEQSFANLEVLVVDDGSTDGTPDLLARWGDPRLRVIRQDVNRGQSAARNRGLQLARAPLIAFQDSDDEWLPHKLVHQIDLLQSQADTAMVYGDLLRIPRVGPPFVIHAPDLVKGRLLDDRPSGYASYGIGFQTCLFRSEALRAVGGFDERLHCFEDLEFFLRFNQRFACYRSKELMVRYYETDGVSKVTHCERAARIHLLRRYWPYILWQRPSWLGQEIQNLRHRRRLDR